MGMEIRVLVLFAATLSASVGLAADLPNVGEPVLFADGALSPGDDYVAAGVEVNISDMARHYLAGQDLANQNLSEFGNHHSVVNEGINVPISDNLTLTSLKDTAVNSVSVDLADVDIQTQIDVPASQSIEVDIQGVEDTLWDDVQDGTSVPGSVIVQLPSNLSEVRSAETFPGVELPLDELVTASEGVAVVFPEQIADAGLNVNLTDLFEQVELKANANIEIMLPAVITQQGAEEEFVDSDDWMTLSDGTQVLKTVIH